MATPTIKNIAFGGATHADGTALASGVPLAQGDTVWINVSMSSVAYLNEEQAPLEMLLQIGTSLSSARYYSGNGTTTWRFSYTIQATDVNDSNGISIPAGYLQRSGQNTGLGYAGLADNSAYKVVTSDDMVVTSDYSGGMPGTPAPYASGSVPYLVATSDSGSSSKDNLTSAPRPTMRVNLIATGMAAGGKVELMEGTTVLGTVKLTQSHMDAGYVDITSSTLTDGAHALSARLTNQPLNAVTSGTLTVTIDTVAPVVTGATPDLLASSDLGISSTDNITSVTTPKVRVNLTATSGIAPGDKVDLMEGTTVLGTVTLTASHGNAGYVDITSPTLTDGVHTLSARLTDKAGNAASTGTLTVTIDTTAAAPTLALASDTGSSATDKITNNGALTITGQESGATLQYSSNSGSTWTNTFTATEGVNSVQVRQTDAAGNVSTASSALVFTLDTVAPVATGATPDLLASSDLGISSTDNITSATRPTMRINLPASFTSVFSAGGKVELMEGATVLGTVEFTQNNKGVPYVDIISSPLTAGKHALSARLTDKAGNAATSGTLTVTIDTTAAAPTLALATDTGSSATDKITNNGALTVTGQESGATLQYSINGGASWTSSFTATAGANSVQVRQTDAAGNVSAASPALAFTLDTAAPVATGATPDMLASSDLGISSTDNITSDTTPTMRVNLTATGMAVGGKVELMEGTTVLGTVTLTKSHMDAGYVDITSSTLTDGAHALRARLTDQAGNAASTGTLTVTIDTPAAAPTLALASDTGSSATDKITNNGALTVTGQESGAMLQYSINGGASWTSSFTATAGANSVQVRQTDAAGNVSAASPALVFTLDTAAPVATGATPDMLASSDLGISSTDNLTSAKTPTMRVNLISTGMAAGGKVELMEGTTVLGTVTLAKSQMDAGYVDITSSTLTDGAHALSARLTDQAGNAASTGTVQVTIDTTAPTAAGVPDLAAASDNGTSSTDNITSVTTPVMRISLGTSGAAAGDTVDLLDGSTVRGTATLTATNITNGYVDITSSALTVGRHSLASRQFCIDCR